MFISKNNLKSIHFVLLMSFLNFIFFHLPFFRFVFNNIDYKSFNGIVLIISLVITVIILNAFVFLLLLFASHYISKFVLVLFFLVNSVAVYFINTYSVIIDESMISNILNTNFEESTSYFSTSLLFYLVFLGILPSWFIYKARIINESKKKVLITISITFLFILSLVFANASNWMWIDKNSKTLGGLAMPWSYTVNISLFYKHQSDKNKKEILLPNATIKDNSKSVVVLVIGESARSQNFSLYGYKNNTNPLLSKIPNVYHFEATSAATYTTAGVKAILDYKDTGDLYEILPNYLYRNDVEVIWKTTNWGEPPIHIKKYENREILATNCKSKNCNYDEILLTGLKEQIIASKKNKILIVLHTSTSHGPSYNKKYPAEFETFKPVCNSVELGNCTQKELINAYDNTIIYTDYILSQVIGELKQFFFVSSTRLSLIRHVKRFHFFRIFLQLFC
jgi:lipid A ethanolaminephosphotransferase